MVVLKRSGRLDRKVALITGSIGRADVMAFAREGACIVGSGLDPADANSTSPGVTETNQTREQLMDPEWAAV